MNLELLHTQTPVRWRQAEWKESEKKQKQNQALCVGNFRHKTLLFESIALQESRFVDSKEQANGQADRQANRIGERTGKRTGEWADEWTALMNWLLKLDW